MHALAALILGGILTLRTRAMVREPGPTRSLWVSLAALEAAELLQVDGVRRRIDTAAGAAGLCAVLRHGLVVVAAGGVRSLLDGVTADDAKPATTRRPHVLLGAAGLVALLSPFAVLDAAEAGTVLAGVSEQRDFRTNASVLVSWSGYLAYLSWALAGSSRLCSTYSRQAPAGPTRTGLVLTGTGTATGFAYVALKAVELRRWARREPHDLLGDEGHAQRSVVFVVLVLISVGSGYEALHARALGWRDIRRARRSLRRLFPLWQVINELYPGQVMFPNHQPAPRWVSAETVRFLNIRRRTEINDGFRALNCELPVRLRATALEESLRHTDDVEGARALAVAASLQFARRIGQPLPAAALDQHDPGGHDKNPNPNPNPEPAPVDVELVARHLYTSAAAAVVEGLVAVATSIFAQEQGTGRGLL